MLGMFGPRVTTVFRSRWRAVWWALSILLGVWLTVPHATTGDGGNDDGQSQAQAQQDAQAVAEIIGAPTPTPSDHHVNPWAKDPPK